MLGLGCDSGPTEGKNVSPFSVSIDALPDTIYGRFVATTAHPDSFAFKDVSLTIDPGTAREQVVPSTVCSSITALLPTTFYWCGPEYGKNPVWTLYPPTALENGPHTIHLDMVDANDRHVSAERTFVTYVPDIQYTATFPDAGSASDATALGVNATGMIVGWVKDGSGQRASAWSSSGTLSVLDAATSQAIAVNATGDAVGTSAGKPVLWSRGGRQELGGNGSATAINSAGLIGITRGFSMSLWQNGTLTDFGGCLPNGGSATPLCGVSSLNDLGQAVGPAFVPHGNTVVAGYQIAVSYPAPPAPATPFTNASSIVLNNRSRYGVTSPVRAEPCSTEAMDSRRASSPRNSESLRRRTIRRSAR